MKELLEYIVKAIVNNPEEVIVTQRESVDFQGLIIYSIKVAQADKGVLIGRKGRTINAIRDLATIAAIRLSQRVKILVEEDENDRARRDSRDEESTTNTPNANEDMLEDNMEGLA